jgi:hypothetical protein
VCRIWKRAAPLVQEPVPEKTLLLVQTAPVPSSVAMAQKDSGTVQS